jgi:hypothetical protein
MHTSPSHMLGIHILGTMNLVCKRYRRLLFWVDGTSRPLNAELWPGSIWLWKYDAGISFDAVLPHLEVARAQHGGVLGQYQASR